EPGRLGAQPGPAPTQFLAGTGHPECLLARFRQRWHRSRAPTAHAENATNLRTIEATRPEQPTLYPQRNLAPPLSLPETKSLNQTWDQSHQERGILAAFARTGGQSWRRARMRAGFSFAFAREASL